MRSVEAKDARVLYEWRNDEETRRMSASSTLLRWKEHVAWLGKVLAGGFPGRSLYIAETASGEPVGTVRSDERADGFVEVSYTIAPAYRGRGMGKRMVVQFAREYLSGRKLAARIRKDANPASEAIARALGLSPQFDLPAEEVGGPGIVEWR